VQRWSLIAASLQALGRYAELGEVCVSSFVRTMS
jgi:hypothetical protein